MLGDKIRIRLKAYDARVLDQIIYKWDHSRRIIAKVMAKVTLCHLASHERAFYSYRA